MIQDIAPRLYHNEYRPKEPVAGDRLFIFHEGKILAGENESGELVFPNMEDLNHKEDEKEGDGMFQYLFSIDDISYFLYMGDSIQKKDCIRKENHFEEEESHKTEDQAAMTQPSFRFMSLRAIRRARPKDECFAAMTAWHLHVWYRNNRYCGRCASAMVHASDERMLRCPVCDNRIYPRINPAVIVGVRDGNRILMTRYAGRPYKGNALIAGFCEVGETMEDTVRREVMEETGLKVKNIRYYKSQPWGFAGDLLMGFYCDVDGSRKVHLDQQELEQAIWVSREEIGEEAANLSLTADMIMHFKYECDCTGDKDTAEKYNKEASILSRIRCIWHDHTPGIPEQKGVSAVVIPLVEKEGEYHILYEQRACGLAHQPGEICFPGGRVETGESPREAALRETAEELLISTDQVEVLAALDAQMGPSGAAIWPFVAVLHDYQGTFSKDEVARTFTIPLSWYEEHQPRFHNAELVTDPGQDFPYELIPGGRNYPFRKKKHKMVFYQTPEAVIWGVTAKITEDFLKKIME